jgi:Tol biopolymer transport system component
MELCPRCGTALPDGSQSCQVCLVAESAPEARRGEQLAVVEAEPLAPAQYGRWERLLERPERRRAARVVLSLALVVVVLLVSVGAWRAFVGSAWGARLRGMNEIVFVGAPINPLAGPQGQVQQTMCITTITSSNQQTWNVGDPTNCSSLIYVRASSGGSGTGALTVRGGLYLMRPDGSGLHRLTNVPDGAYFSPVWSPDGAHIAAFVLYPTPGFVARLIVMDADGSNAHLIPAVSLLIGTFNSGFTEVATPLTRLISWSPDGSRLVAPAGSGQFALLNADGSNIHQFTGTTPTWSPDGRSLAYYSESQTLVSSSSSPQTNSPYSDPQLRVEVLNTQTFQTQEVATLADLSGSALAWSPDGRFLAYSAVHLDEGQSTPTGQVMLARADGSDPRVVVQWSGGLVEQIAWSPDSAQIAAVVGDVAFLDSNNGLSTAQELYVVNTNGSHSRDLGASDGEEPSWSPDGRHLIFVNLLDALRSSVLVVADTGASPVSLRRLNAPLPFAFGPSWSPLAGF